MMTWTQRIERAKKRGEFSQDDKRAASMWCTCAVGEQFMVRHMTDVRKLDANGRTIELIGYDFGDVVYENDVQKAEQLLLKITTLSEEYACQDTL